MNDKLLTIAFMLTLVMLGVNGFLLMASENLYDQEGNQLNIYYGMDASATAAETDAEAIDIDAGVSISSEVPSQQQGITVVTRDSNPVGLDYMSDLVKLGVGVQLVMLRFSEMFPVLTPIVNAVVAFAFLVQGLAIAYLGSILIRGVLGRVT